MLFVMAQEEDGQEAGERQRNEQKGHCRKALFVDASGKFSHWKSNIYEKKGLFRHRPWEVARGKDGQAGTKNADTQKPND